MTVASIAETYLSARLVSDQYAEHLRRVAGRVPSLDSDCINTYLRSRRESVTPTTTANERRMLLTLWRYAYESRLTESAPRGVLSIRQEHSPVRAWTVEGVRRLVNSSFSWKGHTFENGVDKGLFMEVWVRLAYDTGARFGDLFAFTIGNIEGHFVQWTMRKTGIAMTRRIAAITKERAMELAQSRGGVEILGGVCHRRTAFRMMRQLLDKSGMAGSGRWLRRSAATHVERQQAGAAQRFLGHRTPGLAHRSYLDVSQLEDGGLMPPSVD